MAGSIRITNIFLDDNSVQSRNLADGAVTSGKLAAGSVNQNALGSGAVTSAKIANGAVGSAALAAGAVTNSNMAADSVNTTRIVNGAVTSPKLGSSAVSTANIADGAVTTPKLGDGSVTQPKLGGSAVATGNIADGAVTLPKLGVNPVLQGVHTIWVPSKAITPSVVSGATPLDYGFSLSTKPTFGALSFPKAQAAYADFNIAWPKSWDKGTVTFTVYWTPDTTVGGCVWGLNQLNTSNGNSLNASYVSVSTSTSTGLTVGNVYSAPVISATVSASVIESVSFFQISRIVGNASDTMTGAAILLGVMVKYTVSGTNDN